MTQNKSMAMKARVANQIRTALYKKPIDIPDKEKITLFNQIYNWNRDMHWELLAYKDKKKKKAKVQAERVARGYKSKKKTPLADFQKKNLEIS